MAEKWDDALPGCMPGPFRANFGQHPHDRRRALAWAESLRSRGSRWEDARAQIEAYLASEQCSVAEMNSQVAHAAALLRERL